MYTSASVPARSTLSLAGPHSTEGPLTDVRAQLPDEAAGPIFIGGTGRSGTTLLVHILSRLPGVFVYPYESKFLVAPGGLLHVARKGWRERELEPFLERLRGRWFDRRARRGTGRQVGLRSMIGPDRLEDTIRRLKDRLARSGGRRDPELAAWFCHELFAAAVEEAGARRWCEKTPRNALFVDRLYEFFPTMRFLHVIRDGRDVAASMLGKQFWPMTGQGFRRLREFRGPVTAEKAIRYWVEVLSLTRRAAARVPPESYLELRLEDLVREPGIRLRQVCAFLGEEFTEELLEQDLSQHHTGRWRTDLSAEQREALHTIAGDALLAEGYPTQP